MSVLDIVLWPNPLLTETCVQIDEVTDEIRTLAQDMLDTMYAAKGRGLAASQVGALHRLFVMDVGWKEGKSDPLICINPMLSEIDGRGLFVHSRCIGRRESPLAGPTGLVFA
jgi:peptide deformylase